MTLIHNYFLKVLLSKKPYNLLTQKTYKTTSETYQVTFTNIYDFPSSITSAVNLFEKPEETV